MLIYVVDSLDLRDLSSYPSLPIAISIFEICRAILIAIDLTIYQTSRKPVYALISEVGKLATSVRVYSALLPRCSAQVCAKSV